MLRDISVVFMLVMVALPCTDQLRTSSKLVLSEGIVQRDSRISVIRYWRPSTRSVDGRGHDTWAPLTLVAAQSTEELPTPSSPTLTFIDISNVNISWYFNFSAVDPARNVCFGIEFQNNTRTENVSSLICNGESTYFIFPWLLRGERYRFRIYATDGATRSSASDWSFLFTDGIDAPPGPPNRFRAEVLSDTEMELMWDALPLLVSSIYEICYNASIPLCNEPQFLDVGQTSHPLVGLQPNTTYYFKIRASIAMFYSVWSPWINATTQLSSLPVLIIDERLLMVLSKSVFVQWEPVPKNLLRYTFREYYVDIQESVILPRIHHNFTTGHVSQNITGLEPSTRYYIAVSYSVTDHYGNVVQSGLSDPVNVTTLPLHHPPVIKCTACNATSKDTLQISWTILSDDDHVTEAYAVFNVSSDGSSTEIAIVDDATVMQFNVTGLHPNRGYQFTVQPLGHVINGSESSCPEPSCRTKQSAPSGPPTNIQISVLNSTAVALSWDPPAEDNGIILRYTVVYFCEDESRCADKQLSTGSRSVVVTGLHPFTHYYFVVSASTVAGAGPKNDRLSFTTLEAAPDGIPQKLTLYLPFPTLLTFTWSPPLLEHRNGKIIGYHVQWGTSDSPSSTGTLLGTTTVNSTALTINHLQTSTTYEISVAAYNKAGTGPYATFTGRTTDNEYDLAFSSKLVPSAESKRCQDIKLYWNQINTNNISYIVSVQPIENDSNTTTEWSSTTQNGSVIIPHSQLAIGEVYKVELMVIITAVANVSEPVEVLTSQWLNVTLPACSKLKSSTLLWSCVGGGLGFVSLVLFCICCLVCYRRRRKYKLLQQARRPVGGADADALGSIKEAEEATLLGHTTEWRSSSRAGSDEWRSSSRAGSDDVPMLKVDASETSSTTESGSFVDFATTERPLPLGADDS